MAKVGGASPLAEREQRCRAMGRKLAALNRTCQWSPGGARRCLGPGEHRRFTAALR